MWSRHYLWFQASTGSLGMYPSRARGYYHRAMHVKSHLKYSNRRHCLHFLMNPLGPPKQASAGGLWLYLFRYTDHHLRLEKMFSLSSEIPTCNGIQLTESYPLIHCLIRVLEEDSSLAKHSELTTQRSNILFICLCSTK